MKAIVLNVYGGPDVLELKEVDQPEVTENDVLVRVHAAGLTTGAHSPPEELTCPTPAMAA